MTVQTKRGCFNFDGVDLVHESALAELAPEVVTEDKPAKAPAQKAANTPAKRSEEGQ